MADNTDYSHPFEATEEELEGAIDDYVTATVASLGSFYLELPKGKSFLSHADFTVAYELLRSETDDFSFLDRKIIRKCVEKNPTVFAVLRSIVGVSPPELADLAGEVDPGFVVGQNTARKLDQTARRGVPVFTPRAVKANRSAEVLIEAACRAIERGPTPVAEDKIHRLDKFDTMRGLKSLQAASEKNVPYSTLLYERMLGRPFATHRDSISELVGDIVEGVAALALNAANIPYYKSGNAERFEDMDQAPDFFIPDKLDPIAVIEAKLAQDDGTARDKVTRVQHLRKLSDEGNGFEVIACIDGRGFRVRPENMKKLIRAARGKVFTVATRPCKKSCVS